MSQLKIGRPSRKDKAISSVKELNGGFIRMNVNVQKPFYKKIKQRALDEDKSITELVITALTGYISK